MGGAAGKLVFVANQIGGRHPAVRGFELGHGFSEVLNQATTEQIASGTLVSGNVGGAWTSIGFHANSFSTFLSESELSVIAPIAPGRSLNSAATYTYTINGKTPPGAWAENMRLLSTMGFSLATASGVRVEGPAAQLDNERRGANWNSTVADGFIRRASYTRYFAYAWSIRFDSACKRDKFLRLAGSSSREALFPETDVKGLGRFLVDAGADLTVSVVGLGQSAATESVLASTKCATNVLPACRALETELTGLLRNVSASALPTTFRAAPEGTNDWFVDAFEYASKESLLPP